MTIERWSLWRQREALLQLHQKNFQESSEFLGLLEQFDYFFAGAITSKAKFKFGFEVERQEVVNLMVEALLRQGKNGARIAEYAAAADNPWAYIGTSLQQWATTLWGHRGINLEFSEHIPAPERADDDGVMADAIKIAHAILAERTPKRLQKQLLELIWFLSVNPPQRLSYERYEREAASQYCPSFDEGQISAVSNLVWGGRPKQSETSIMGQLLLDLEWDYRTSATHMRALALYEAEMLARSGKTKV